MARRNLFQPPAPPSGGAEPPPMPAAPEPRFPNTGAISGVKSTLRDLSSNAVREIDPAMIEDDGPTDRLPFADPEIAGLLESIQTYGQQVPIMVRTIPDRPGRYRVVYGRRRLRALRLIGMPAKALVRSLSDEQAVLAQGQENSQRLDPSFIEKALFAAELARAGYEQRVILDALAVDRPMLSRMGKVARRVPASVVEIIGPAHGVGRRRWEEFADKAHESHVDLAALTESLASALAERPSDERFAMIFESLAAGPKGDPAPRTVTMVTDTDLTRIAEIHDAPAGLTIRVSARDTPDFAEWMRAHASELVLRLHNEWKTSTRSGRG